MPNRPPRPTPTSPPQAPASRFFTRSSVWPFSSPLGLRSSSSHPSTTAIRGTQSSLQVPAPNPPAQLSAPVSHPPPDTSACTPRKLAHPHQPATLPSKPDTPRPPVKPRSSQMSSLILSLSCPARSSSASTAPSRRNPRRPLVPRSPIPLSAPSQTPSRCSESFPTWQTHTLRARR